jgi:hypothetical protein
MRSVSGPRLSDNAADRFAGRFERAPMTAYMRDVCELQEPPVAIDRYNRTGDEIALDEKEQTAI